MSESMSEREFVKSYDPNKYERPSIAADAIVFRYRNRRLEVLLIQRKNHPYKGRWVFPGGFIEVYEDPDDAVRRELKEETGVEADAMRQLGAFGHPERDPRYHIISIAYIGVVAPEKADARAADDAADARWHSPDDTPPLGFDHDMILQRAMRRLREATRRPSFAQHFFRGDFNGADLHGLYEAVFGEKIDGERFLERLAKVCEKPPATGEPVRFDLAALREFEERLGCWWR